MKTIKTLALTGLIVPKEKTMFSTGNAGRLGTVVRSGIVALGLVFAAMVELTAADSPFHPGGKKSFDSLAAISDAAIEARINVGFHFRETCEISQILGRAIGDAVVESALPPRTH